MEPPSLRVAFVTGTLQLGGSTTFLCNLAGELVRRRVSCHVFGDGPLHPLATDFEALRVPVFVQNPREAIFEDRLDAVLHQLRDYQPTAVVATIAPFAFELLRYVPRDLLRIAMVQSDDPLVYGTLEKYAAFIDIVAGVSTTIVQRLESMDVFKNVTKRYLPYGVAVPPRPIEAPTSEKPLRILYLGRVINEQKRVQLFPQIAADLRKAGVPFSWTIAGDGPDLDLLKEEMESPQPECRIEFLGALKYADVGRVLKDHDIFILTSDYEGLPLSLLEAMANGLVPIVSDLESGIREVVNNATGMLVPVGHVSGYADAIVHLHSHRDELASKSAAARARVEKEFSIKAMTDRWMNIFANIPETPADWPRRWNIGAPLIDPENVRYTAPFRFMRRRLLRPYHFFRTGTTPQ